MMMMIHTCSVLSIVGRNVSWRKEDRTLTTERHSMTRYLTLCLLPAVEGYYWYCVPWLFHFLCNTMKICILIQKALPTDTWWHYYWWWVTVRAAGGGAICWQHIIILRIDDIDTEEYIYLTYKANDWLFTIGWQLIPVTVKALLFTCGVILLIGIRWWLLQMCGYYSGICFCCIYSNNPASAP